MTGLLGEREEDEEEEEEEEKTTIGAFSRCGNDDAFAGLFSFFF